MLFITQKKTKLQGNDVYFNMYILKQDNTRTHTKRITYLHQHGE